MRLEDEHRSLHTALASPVKYFFSLSLSARPATLESLTALGIEAVVPPNVHFVLCFVSHFGGLAVA